MIYSLVFQRVGGRHDSAKHEHECVATGVYGHIPNLAGA
jgi:hypothetical protein